MLDNKKEFFTGVGLMICFLVVLGLIFSPIYNGKNGIDYLDNLYNTISKGSAYFIPEYKIKAAKQTGNMITATFKMKDEKQAKETALLFTKSGASATYAGSEIKLSGDVGSIVLNCLEDSEQMFHNHGDVVKAKYGYDERQVLFNWWSSFKNMTNDLNRQKKFEETKFLGNVSKRAIECAYNYYKIEPQNISEKWELVVFSLAFYVIYTMWYGYAIRFMFEGWGMKLEH